MFLLTLLKNGEEARSVSEMLIKLLISMMTERIKPVIAHSLGLGRGQGVLHTRTLGRSMVASIR